MSTPGGGAAPGSAMSSVLATLPHVKENGFKLIDAVEWAINQWFEELVFLKDSLFELKAMFDRLVAAVETYAAESGFDAQPIRDMGSQWIDEVGFRASTQHARLQRAQLPSAGYWEGLAASEYYFGVVPNQTGALMVVREATEEAHDALVDIANAIDSYWSDLGVALGVLAGSLVAAVSLAFTKLGVPLAVAGGLAAIYYFDRQLIQLDKAFTNTMDSQSKILGRVMKFRSPMENGSWPSIKGADNILYDATVRDDDGVSQWQPTRQPN